MRSAVCLSLGLACLSGALAGPAAAAGIWSSSPKELDRQIDLLAEQIMGSLADRKVGTIAVSEFPTLEGRQTDLGRLLAEELTTRLFRTGKVQVIERRLLAKVIAEQKLGDSGVLDETTAARLGRLVGADALVTGTIADLTTRIRVNARIIAAETGTVSAAATVTLPMDPETQALLRGGAGAPARDPARFDGTWRVLFTCPEQDGTLGYALRFFGTVKDGVFHALSGTEGQPPYLALDGHIEADGTATLLGTGMTGDPKYALNSQRKGTKVVFHLKAVFSDNRGTGRREELRPCEAVFAKQ